MERQTSITVNKQPVADFLKTGKDSPFLIPEYQRPYSWGEEQVKTLFDDIVEFTKKKIENEQTRKSKRDYYFLGSLVFFTNEDGEQEIIDGQQRLTTLLLLLRAIYAALEKGTQTDEAKNFIGQIQPTIWQQDELTGIIDRSKLHISSRVISSESNANKVFHNILEIGAADSKAKDNYSKNYLLLQKYYAELSQNDPTIMYHYVNNLLNNTIFMPISADKQETALTIFTTLNNRGLPLSDADIFKSIIYGSRANDEDKKAFIYEWQQLADRAEDVGQEIQRLFTYYMFYCLAKDQKTDGTILGVRKYFAEGNNEKIKIPDILKTLNRILNIDAVMLNHDKIDGEDWSENAEILKKLDMLNSFPNEFGKYPIIVYYLQHYNLPDFTVKFDGFLRKLIAEVFPRYIVRPTITEVKPSIIKLNSEIIKSDTPNFEFKQFENKTGLLSETIIKPQNKQLTKLILKVLAYNDPKQVELLPDKWEIEHILPKAHENSYYLPDYTEEEIEKLIVQIGNLLPLEKRRNVKAGNAYFDLKKKYYKDSKICIVKRMAEEPDWSPKSIERRNAMLADELINMFETWANEYNGTKLCE